MNHSWPDLVAQINSDNNLFALEEYPLLTVYDDNFFLRNDYDVLTASQRRYVIKFMVGQGFKQKSGRVLINDDCSVEFLKTKALAQSSFTASLLRFSNLRYYCVTPTLFAECLFYAVDNDNEPEQMQKLAQLMEKAPFNMTLLKDINRTRPIRDLTIQYADSINAHQKRLIKEKFKFRRGLD